MQSEKRSQMVFIYTELTMVGIADKQHMNSIRSEEYNIINYEV